MYRRLREFWRRRGSEGLMGLEAEIERTSDGFVGR